MDAFTDYYGDWLMELLLRQPRPGGADAEWRTRQLQDPAVRRALDVWSDPGATRAQREWAARVLLDAGVPGVWQGSLPAEAAETPRLLPAGEPASLTGQPERLLPASGQTSKEGNIPFFAQESQESCGVACLRMAQRKLGAPVLSEADTIRQLGSLYGRGIRFSQMPEAAMALGLKGRLVEGADVVDLARDFTSENVIILDVAGDVMYGIRPGKGPGYPIGHAVVLTDIQVGPAGLERVVVHDPAVGPSRVITPRLFIDAWVARWQRYVVVTARGGK